MHILVSKQLEPNKNGKSSHDLKNYLIIDYYMRERTVTNQK